MTWLLIACATFVSAAPAPASRLCTGMWPMKLAGQGDGRSADRGSLLPLVIFVGAAALGVVAVDRIAVVIALAMSVATVAYTLRRRRRARQARARAAVVATFLGHLVTGIKAGSPLAEATARAAERLDASTDRDLLHDVHRCVAALRTGAAADRALVSSTVGELREVGALWALSTSRGLPIAEMLARARDRIDHAQRHQAATEAALAGPKATAVVLSLLPAAGVLMGAAMGANPLGVLVGTRIGGILLASGTALVCIGFLTCQRIIEGAAS